MPIKQKSLRKADIEIVYRYCNLGKYFGLAPCLSEELTNKISKWNVSLLLCLFIVYATYKIIERILEQLKGSSEVTFIMKVIDNTHFTTNLFYIGMSLFGSQFKKEKWIKLFENINLIEKKFFGENVFNQKNIRFFTMKLMVYHITFLIFHLGESLFSIFNDKLLLIRFTLTLRIAIFNQIFDVILIYMCNDVLQRRYTHLTKMIISLINGRHNAILKEEEKQARAFKLRNVFSIYQLLHESVEQMNSIFGWKIYLFLQSAVLFFLETFNFGVITIHDQSQYHLEAAATKHFTFFSLSFFVSMNTKYIFTTSFMH